MTRIWLTRWEGSDANETTRCIIGTKQRAEVFDERSQAEKFCKKAQLALASGGGQETAQAETQTLKQLVLASGGGEETAQAKTQTLKQLALASGGGEESAQAETQTLKAIKEETAATIVIQDKQEGELASGRLGKETKEEKEDELASGSRAWEKGKEDPTSGSLGKEAKVEKEDKLASGRTLEKDKELPSLDSCSGEVAKESRRRRISWPLAGRRS